MRYLAIDLGQKRTGLAVGDDVLRIASPLEVIATTSDELRMTAIAQAIEEHGPKALVVGLPLNADSSEGEAAKGARAFAGPLQQRFGLPVHFADERHSSDDADEKMARSGLTRGQKKGRRDALAAAAFLQRWLDELPRS